MSDNELQSFVAARNPQIDPRRVAEYLRHVEQLRLLGVAIRPHYRLNHPFESSKTAAALRSICHGENRSGQSANDQSVTH